MALPLFAALLFVGQPNSESKPEVIFEEKFANNSLSAAWKQSFSVGASVVIQDKTLYLKARRNTFASISRPIGSDFVTAQCRIKPAPADSWTTSIFLYWSASNWCQLSIRPQDGGRVYATEMASGIYTEFNLGQRNFNALNGFRIELGKNIVRFCTSADGVSWRNERFADRPNSFAGPPTVILGKGYGGVAGYEKPLLANNYADHGEFGISLISNLLVFKTPVSKLKASAIERNAMSYSLEDGLGKEMLNVPGGPTFEAIAKRLPGIKYPREVVGVAEHPHDVGIASDGTLQLKDWLGDTKSPDAYLEVGNPPVRIGSVRIPVAKTLSSGGVPTVNIAFDHDHVHFIAKVFAWSQDMSPDNPVSAFLSIAATTKSQNPQRIKLRLNMSPSPGGWRPIEWSGEVSAASPVQFSARSERTDKWNGFQVISNQNASQRLAEYEASWRSKLDTGLRLTTPETRINNSYRAWMAYNYINVDKVNRVYEIHDGTGFYEQIFAYSALLFCNALDMYGHPKDAEKYLDSLLTFQQPDGLLTLNYGLPDMGALLLTLSDHYRFTGDRAWLKRVTPNMLKACDWILSKRREACLQPKSSVTYGLIKFRPYCDYPDAEFSYLSDTYVVVGMEAAARQLRKIGLSREAGKIAAEAAEYRKDILTSMDRSKISRNGLSILDLEPETHRLLKRSQYKGGEYYGLVAPSILETGFLAPFDRHTKWITEFMERRSGFICGMSEFQGGVDHAYTYGYWLTCLQQNRPDRAVLGLYGSMAGAISRDTYAGVEVMHIKTGVPEDTLPHTYSGTQQLRLLRMMLLREGGDKLEVGQAVPRGWLANGKSLQLKSAPTLFGPLSLSYTSNLEAHRIDATLTPNFREAPALIRVWFRHPDSKPIRSVSVNGKPYRNFDSNAVSLPGISGPMRVTVRY